MKAENYIILIDRWLDLIVTDTQSLNHHTFSREASSQGDVDVDYIQALAVEIERSVEEVRVNISLYHQERAFDEVEDEPWEKVESLPAPPGIVEGEVEKREQD